MGGGGFVGGALPLGAASWCSGNKVVQDLNDLFDQNPTNPQYQDAKTASLALFQKAANTGSSADLWTAYSNAYDVAGMTLCAGWASYLTALGNLSPTPGNGGNTVTTSPTATSSAILTFSNVPAWMANGLNVSDSSTPGAITGGQTVSSFTANTVTLTANVNATVNSGDTIVFSLPGGQGQSDIQAIAQARVDGLTNNKKMKTHKHDPHDPQSSGHAVKVTHETDNSITITSPFIPPGAPANRRGLGPTRKP
jgi:flagellar basal body rod protein FlgC